MRNERHQPHFDVFKTTTRAGTYSLLFTVKLYNYGTVFVKQAIYPCKRLTTTINEVLHEQVYQDLWAIVRTLRINAKESAYFPRTSRRSMSLS